MGNNDIKNMSLGDVLYLDWKELPEDMPERNGRASLILGQILNYSESGTGSITDQDPESRTSEGMLCVRVEGHRHEAAYGAKNKYFTFLSQEAFDKGVEGAYLGRNAPPELVDKLVGCAYAAITSGHLNLEGDIAHITKWGQVERDLEGMKAPTVQSKE